MNKSNKIAKSLVANITTDIRHLLKMDISVDITDEQNWQIPFDGPVQLTPEGVAKWSSNGVLDKSVVINGNKAFILQINNEQQCNNICSLFNTINGNVNEYVYNKFIKNVK